MDKIPYETSINSLIDQLDLLELSKLYNTNRIFRDELSKESSLKQIAAKYHVSLTTTFPILIENILLSTDYVEFHSYENLLMICIELGLRELYKIILETLDDDNVYPNKFNMEYRSEIFDDLYAVGKYSIQKDEIEYLKELMPWLHAYYDWNSSQFNDYNFDYMSLSVKLDNINIIEYILNKGCDFDECTSSEHEEYRSALLKCGFITSCEVSNVKLAYFFLEYHQNNISLIDTHNGSDIFNCLLSLDDIHLLIEYYPKIRFGYWWYDSWISIKSSFDITIKNNNPDAAKIVLDAVNKHSNRKIRKRALDYYNHNFP